MQKVKSMFRGSPAQKEARKRPVSKAARNGINKFDNAADANAGGSTVFPRSSVLRQHLRKLPTALPTAKKPIQNRGLVVDCPHPPSSSPSRRVSGYMGEHWRHTRTTTISSVSIRTDDADVDSLEEFSTNVMEVSTNGESNASSTECCTAEEQTPRCRSVVHQQHTTREFSTRHSCTTRFDTCYNGDHQDHGDDHQEYHGDDDGVDDHEDDVDLRCSQQQPQCVLDFVMSSGLKKDYVNHPAVSDLEPGTALSRTLSEGKHETLFAVPGLVSLPAVRRSRIHYNHELGKVFLPVHVPFSKNNRITLRKNSDDYASTTTTDSDLEGRGSADSRSGVLFNMMARARTC